MKKWIVFCLLSLTAVAGGKRVPGLDDLLSIRTIQGCAISPDGRWIAYSVTSAEMDEDAYISHVWLVDRNTKERFQLTRGKASCTNPQWSPDSKWLAFVTSRDAQKSQIHLIRPNGGEAFALTRSETGVSSFAWSPRGNRIAYRAQDTESEQDKERKKEVGDYAVVRREYLHNHLWVVCVDSAILKPAAGKRLTSGHDFTVGSFSWSPDGLSLAFSATLNPDLIQGHTSDIYILPLDGKPEKIVSQSGPDDNPVWSPDGKSILFSTYMGNERYFALNSRLALIPAGGGAIRVLTGDFDEHPRFVAWNAKGIFFSAMQKTAAHLFLLDPQTGKHVRISEPEDLMAVSFSMTQDGRTIAFVAESPVSMAEVFTTETDEWDPVRLTEMTDQTKDFLLGSREVISWKSKDGALIEGVLIKPADFDPSIKAPLLCIIHGGPTGIDRPVLLSRDLSYYPADLWAGRGALILKVNYRGSAGYGEKFRRLNERNLGVGDAWDVLSGVDELIRRGWVDPKMVGCMGWSQGGYISAFLTASSDRFCAISVGAGISNWETYYYNTDITQFTVNYLGAHPIHDPKVYALTSPMTYIKKARTPTMIQHGELDRRVPIPNAYELRQGLEDMGVPVEMVVYKGFGHGITKPKSQKAVMHHNLVWFNHYLWGDPLPDLSDPIKKEE